MAIRPSSRMARNWAIPRPRVPTRFCSGTRHWWKCRPWVSEECQPSLRYARSTVNPGVPAGTRIALISGEPSGRSPVRAVTVTTLVIGVPELVMNAFAPSITHSPPT